MVLPAYVDRNSKTGLLIPDHGMRVTVTRQDSRACVASSFKTEQSRPSRWRRSTTSCILYPQWSMLAGAKPTACTTKFKLCNSQIVIVVTPRPIILFIQLHQWYVTNMHYVIVCHRFEVTCWICERRQRKIMPAALPTWNFPLRFRQDITSHIYGNRS